VRSTRERLLPKRLFLERGLASTEFEDLLA